MSWSNSDDAPTLITRTNMANISVTKAHCFAYKYRSNVILIYTNFKPKRNRWCRLSHLIPNFPNPLLPCKQILKTCLNLSVSLLPACECAINYRRIKHMRWGSSSSSSSSRTWRLETGEVPGLNDNNYLPPREQEQNASYRKTALKEIFFCNTFPRKLRCYCIKGIDCLFSIFFTDDSYMVSHIQDVDSTHVGL